MKSQTAGAGWRVLARRHPRGLLLATHQHRDGQLVYALSGVMLVETSGSRWTVPPQRALWIPPGHPHAIRMLSGTEMRTVYFHPSLIAQAEGFVQKDRVHAALASPLLKALVLELFDRGHGDGTAQLMARLLLQSMCEALPLATELRLPSDERLRRAADRVLAYNGWSLPLHELAACAAMSERSFSRHFTQDVGLSFRAWKQQARILASLDMLAAGRSVKQVAAAIGFATDAAYVASFREMLGCTPTSFRE